VNGVGRLVDVDLSAYTKMTKVCILTQEGKEIVKDLPNEPVVAPGVKPTVAGHSVAEDIEVRIVTTRPDDHHHPHKIEYTIVVVVKDQNGKPFVSDFILDDGHHHRDVARTTTGGSYSEKVTLHG